MDIDPAMHARVCGKLTVWFYRRLRTFLPQESDQVLAPLAFSLRCLYENHLRYGGALDETTQRFLDELQAMPAFKNWGDPVTVERVRQINQLAHEAMQQCIYNRLLAVASTEFAAPFIKGETNPLLTPAWQVGIQRMAEIHQEVKNLELDLRELKELMQEAEGIFKFMNNNQALSVEAAQSFDQVWEQANRYLAQLRAQGLTDVQIREKVERGEIKTVYPHLNQGKKST